MFKFLIAMLLICTPALAVEIPIPDGVSETQLKEWVAILQERKANQAVEQNAIVKAEVEKAKTSIDAYRESLGVDAKFAVEEAPKEVEKVA